MRAAVREHDLSTEPTEYDPLSPAVIADPYPWYRRLLAGDRVHHDATNDLWVISRWDDVHEAIRNPGALSSAEGIAFRRMYLPMMITVDPPDHTRLRRIVSREFTPRTLERWSAMIDRLAAEAVRRLDTDAPVDFVAAVASPFPVAVIAAILGIGDADLPELRRISDDVIEGFKLAQPENRAASVIVDLVSRRGFVESIARVGMRFPAASGAFLRGLTAVTRRLVARERWADDAARSPRAVADLQKICAALVRARRRSPCDDLVSKLLAEHPDGHLSDSEIFFFFLLLLIAGHETTTNLLANGLYHLLRHPEQERLLRRRPEAVTSAVEEFLRYDTPVAGTIRIVVADVEFEGHAFRKGDPVAAMLAAANRDPQRFDRPDELDVLRAPNRHLAFGYATHFCLGAGLARLEAQTLFATMLRRFPSIALREDRPPWKPQVFFRELVRLPVEVGS